MEIQRECCRMMAELTAGNACTEAVLASDAASMLVRAMMSLGQARGFWLALVEHAPSTLTPHPHTNPNPPRHKDAAVQWQGCRALTNLSCGGDECRKAVRDAGGANALMLAMEMHPEDLPLARLRLAPCIARTHARRARARPRPCRPCARTPWRYCCRPSKAAVRCVGSPRVASRECVRCSRRAQPGAPPASGAPRVAPAPHGLTRPPARPAAAGCCPIQPRSSRQSASALSWKRSSCCSASIRMTSTGRTAPPGAACYSTPSGTACVYSLAGCCCAGLIPALLST